MLEWRLALYRRIRIPDQERAGGLRREPLFGATSAGQARNRKEAVHLNDVREVRVPDGSCEPSFHPQDVLVARSEAIEINRPSLHHLVALGMRIARLWPRLRFLSFRENWRSIRSAL